MRLDFVLRFLCIFGILFVSFCKTYAVTQAKVDSVQILIKSAKTDKKRAYYNDLLARSFQDSDPEKGLMYARRALFYSRRGRVNNYIVDCYNTMGMMHRIMGDNDSSLYFHKLALELINKKKLDGYYLEATYSHLNLAYTRVGDYKKALEYGFRFIKLIEKSKNTSRLAMAYNNIANTYFHIDEYAKAVTYYKKALVIANEQKDEFGVSLLTANIGSMFLQNKEYDSSIVYFRRAAAISKKIKDDVGIAINYTNTAGYFDEIGRYDSSMFYYSKAIELYNRLNMRGEMAGLYYSLARAYQGRKMYTLAIEHATKGLKIAEELGNLPSLLGAHQALTEFYDITGNLPKAYIHYKKYIEVRDSLNKEEAAENLYRVEVDYEYDMKKYADSLEKKKFTELNHQKLQAEKDKSEWRQTLMYVAGGAFVVMLLLSVFIYKGYRDKKAANILILEQQRQTHLQKLEIEQKNREILDSINYARRIQEAILPSKKRVREIFNDSFVIYKPKDIVAGDFYWMDKHNKKILLAAADCTGHGVPGAMVSVVCHNALNRSLREFGISDPGKLLDKTRELVIEHFSHSEEEVKDGMDIALCVIEEHSDGVKIEFAGANNPLWIIRKGSAQVEEIRPDKQPIGVFAEATPFCSQTLVLQRGDAFYIFTDGYADQFGGDKGKKLKASNFKKILSELAHIPMSQQEVKINDTYEAWRAGLEQIDDVCVIGVRI